MAPGSCFPSPPIRPKSSLCPAAKPTAPINPTPPRASTRRRRPTPCAAPARSEEHTSELQSLMRISYAVFCLNKKRDNHNDIYYPNRHNYRKTILRHDEKPNELQQQRNKS